MKEIIGFPMYTLDENGNVYSKYRDGLILTPVLDTTGYFIVTLINDKKRSNKSIHRLLAIHYLDNPDNKPHVNHKDGDKTNNSLGNLEWATVKENTQHAMSLGLFKPREQGKLQSVQQIDMKTGKILHEYISLGEASREIKIPYPNIIKVCKGLRNHAGGYAWKYIETPETSS